LKNFNWLKIVIAVAICLTVGYFSSISTRSSVQVWFPTIEKPFFNPPPWVFAPVWTILYIMMGIAFGIIWNKYQKNNADSKNALLFFGFQLALNALWSFLFFGLRNPLLAFIEIILLWLVIYETIKSFKKIDVLAAKLLYPYLAWVSFATLLNASIWYLNR
jgi:tryptophan-rich sensory protein